MMCLEGFCWKIIKKWKSGWSIVDRVTWAAEGHVQPRVYCPDPGISSGNYEPERLRKEEKWTTYYFEHLWQNET